jgi:tryptophan synthase alpha chain
MSRIAKTFDHLKEKKRTALMPYLTLGYPELESAYDLIPALVEGGADLIELGVPFSDPLADGATIQAAGQRALDNGMTPTLCLEQAQMLRENGITVPFVLMGYYNPIFQMGAAAFAERAAQASIDGVIIPDLPPEESDALRAALAERGIDLIFLLPPTLDPTRMQLVAARTSGFLYLVSLSGVTGARKRLPPNLAAFVHRVRAVTNQPLAIGFGIGTPEQAAQVGQIADGVIVGSALIRAVGESADPPTAARAFVRSLRTNLDNGNGHA